MSQPHFDFWDIINGLLTTLVKWSPAIAIGFVSSWISVQLQKSQKKITTSKQAWVVGIMAFSLSMMINYIASLKFEPWIANACGVGTAIWGKDIIMWIFANWDSILTSLAGLFHIKIKKK